MKSIILFIYFLIFFMIITVYADWEEDNREYQQAYRENKAIAQQQWIADQEAYRHSQDYHERRYQEQIDYIKENSRKIKESWNVWESGAKGFLK